MANYLDVSSNTIDGLNNDSSPWARPDAKPSQHVSRANLNNSANDIGPTESSTAIKGRRRNKYRIQRMMNGAQSSHWTHTQDPIPEAMLSGMFMSPQNQQAFPEQPEDPALKNIPKS